jgi:DNA-3-methyladenine glycosylase
MKGLRCLKDFFNRSALLVAKELIGSTLVKGGESFTIIETEAYMQTDPASHTYRGQTPRTKAMFGESGHLYIYLSYGVHYCMNFVCQKEGIGEGVLIRGIQNEKHFLNGPGKICNHLKIDKDSFYGLSLVEKDSLLQVFQSELSLKLKEKKAFFYKEPLKIKEAFFYAPNKRVTATPRIGISRAKESPYRFILEGFS